MRHKNGKSEKMPDLLGRLGLTRRVLTTFLCIAAVFGIAAVADNYHILPESVIAPVVAALGLPPALLAAAAVALYADLSPAFVDILFVPAAALYWLLLALAIDRSRRILYRQLGKLAIRRLHP